MPTILPKPPTNPARGTTGENKMTEERAPYQSLGYPPEAIKLIQILRYLSRELDLVTVGSLTNADLKAFERTLHHWHQLTEQLVKARLAGSQVQFAEGQGHD